MEKGNVIAVKDFLNYGSSRPVQMSEMQEFWKVCSDEERKQFGDQAREWNKKNGVPGY